MAFAMQILRYHSNLAKQFSGSSPANAALARDRLRRVCDYIEASLGRGLSVEMLARQANLSTHHFARAFKAATGISPHRFVTMRRVERAKFMLNERRLPLAEVALLCGFSSQAHFTRSFSQLAGITPGAYARNRSANFNH
jgi:AraC family transcriptional regulator